MTADRLHVLHVLEALEGGTARHLIDVVTHTTAATHVVVVPDRRVGSLTDETAAARLRSAGADVRLLAMHRTPWSPANLPALARLRSMIRRERPDVVHGHSSIGGLLARMASTHTGIPTVYTPNAISPMRQAILVERLLGWRTDRLIAVSPTEAALALHLRISDRHRIVIIPNGIELARPPAPLDLRADLGLAATKPLVGTIARLVHQKAPEDFVAACAIVAQRVPEAHFVAIGDGRLEAEVEAAIDRTDLRSRFHRIPWLDGAAGVLDQLDVFALSSRFEGAPYSPLEAMRAGTPVVLPDVVGCSDIVEEGVSGRLVPPGDPRALGEAIVELLRDPVSRHRIGDAGRLRVQARYDVRAMGAALGALYQGLAADRERMQRRQWPTRDRAG